MNNSPPPSPRLGWATSALARPSTHVIVSMAILLLDFLTGPLLQFPILFVLPVTLSAWFYSPRWAYAFAVLLPAGRLLIADLVDKPSPLIYIIANATTRMVVLLFLAFLVGRTARQTKALQERVTGLVTICAWSRTVEYEGEWISFEEYLKRRFGLDTSHGISPAEAQRIIEQLKANAAKVARGDTVG
jgi:hypothetical protein